MYTGTKYRTSDPFPRHYIDGKAVTAIKLFTYLMACVEDGIPTSVGDSINYELELLERILNNPARVAKTRRTKVKKQAAPMPDLAKELSAQVAIDTKAKLDDAAKVRKARAVPPKSSPYNFLPGDDIAIQENGELVSGYKYVRSTERFHIVAKDGKETRLWFNYVFPAPKAG